MRSLPLLEASSAQILDSDPPFSLQRVLLVEGQRLLLKCSASEYPSEREERLVSREFTLLSNLASRRTLRAVDLVTFGQKVGACYQDVEGRPLSSDVFGSTLRFSRLAAIVRDLCGVLDELHGKGLVLVGLTPRSTLLTRQGRVVLTAAPFAQPIGLVEDVAPWLDVAYLPYLAPEVVARNALVIDQRADLYSLGVLLYELMCGRPPFDAADPAALIQSHLARQPRLPIEHDPTIPLDLGRLVMKLLAKDPNDRFETAEEFQREFSQRADPATRGSVWEPAESRRRARSSVVFPRALYGRREALARLSALLQPGRAQATIVFLEGEAGAGKTALVRGAQEAERAPASFHWGRFEPAPAARPLSGWAECLRSIARELLSTCSAGELEEKRRLLTELLGANSPWIATLVPEWGTVLGCRPLPTDGSFDSSIERLALAIRTLLSCHATGEAPLVLVLDDLHWIDPSSLRILELILTTSEPLPLVVLASVRAGEVWSNGANLGALQETLTAAGAAWETIRVDPLGTADLHGFVRDTFREGLEDAPEFVEATLKKTGGSPFFVREFLRLLVRRGVLYQPEGSAPWRWDGPALAALPLTDNVVSLLASKIGNLPEEMKEVLRLAAILGRSFTIAELTTVSKRRPSSFLLLLERAVEEGLLQSPFEEGPPSEEELHHAPGWGQLHTYSFVHDWLFESCLASMSAEEREILHLQVGRAFDEAQFYSDREVHRVASHFNAGRRFVQERPELLFCAGLNLRAARAAKQSGAFSQALEFVHAGLDCLARGTGGAADAPFQDAWAEHFELTLALHEEGAEGALLNRQLELMHAWCDDILPHLRDPLAKTPIYDIRISGFKAAKRFSDAVDVALEILEQLGVTFPSSPGLTHVLFGFLFTRKKLPRKKGDLLRLPWIADEHAHAVARIIESVYPAAYLGRPELFPLLVYRHIGDSLRHGNSEYSGVTYSAFAAVLCAMGKFDEADELGRVALELVRHPDATKNSARAFSVYYFLVYPWRYPLREALPRYREGIRDGLAHGDFEFSCYLMTFETLARLHSGESLPELQEPLQRHLDRITELCQERSILMQSILRQLVHDLRGEGRPHAVLDGPHYEETRMMPRCLSPLDENLVFHNYLAKVMLGVFLGDGEAALHGAREGRRVLRGGAFGNYLGAIFVFYASLAELICNKKPRLRWARGNLRRLRRWASGSPSNFLHKYHLLAAELAARSGRPHEATSHYEKAIELAQVHGFVHEAGLAQERAAAFYLAQGMERLARHYLREARHSHLRWGATAVSHRLEVEYAQQFAYLNSDAEQPRSSHVASSESLDYQALLKSSQAISSETLEPRLMERLLRTIVEHAGAQRALLLLEESGQLHVEYEIDVNSPSPFSTRENAEESTRVARSVVRYAARTREVVVLADAGRSELFAQDPHIASRRVRSLLCAPLLNQGRLLGLVYLENGDVSHLFTPTRLEMVSLLTTQAAISIANLRFHSLQLQAHQARINPHFLFNALSSIADLTVTDGPTAERAVLQLANLYRYILTSSREQFVTLEQELEIVGSYLALEKLRYGRKLEFSITRTGDPRLVRLPALVLQPLVENSIRHGLSHKLDGGRVSVQAHVNEHRCWLLVEDDGDGPSPSSQGTGFGLKSIQERLNIAYGERFSFSISHRIGCRVEIEIPVFPA